MLLTFICVIVLYPQSTYATEAISQRETIRVGFFEMDGYHMQDETGKRSGYGYDTLRLMARYWNVRFEYVGYDKSWGNMQKMLEDNEIDIGTFTHKTPDWEKSLIFPDRLEATMYDNCLQRQYILCRTGLYDLQYAQLSVSIKVGSF